MRATDRLLVKFESEQRGPTYVPSTCMATKKKKTCGDTAEIAGSVVEEAIGKKLVVIPRTV